MLFRKKKKPVIGEETLDSVCHPDVNKPYYHDSIFFNGKYYHGTIRKDIAELCDDPINPCRLSMLVKVKTKKLKTIHNGGDSEIIVIEGEILKDYTKK